MESSGSDEYSSARKLGMRAAEREKALAKITSSKGLIPMQSSSGEENHSIGADFSDLALKSDHM
jgi:hypothetical protein